MEYRNNRWYFCRIEFSAINDTSLRFIKAASGAKMYIVEWNGMECSACAGALSIHSPTLTTTLDDTTVCVCDRIGKDVVTIEEFLLFCFVI